ncbi:MAG: hypothetical protein H7X80_08895, partial [bacterium]|nr:hypothetical protein [Candidatus Kapabacteria bacterium]
TMIFAIIITSLPTLVLMLPSLIFREPALVVLIILGFVPTIYIYNCFTILIAMRLEEEIGLFEAVRRCFSLMKGRWWFSFWITVVMAFVVMFVSMIFQLPLQVSMGVATYAGSDGTGWILFIGVALSTIGSYLMYSILILSCSVLYYNLVEHKEGVGMAERISEIGADSGVGGGVGEGASGATSL